MDLKEVVAGGGFVRSRLASSTGCRVGHVRRVPSGSRAAQSLSSEVQSKTTAIGNRLALAIVAAESPVPVVVSTRLPSAVTLY